MNGINKNNTTGEIRSTFLEFFRKEGHEVLRSAPLVPDDDPTLLFINAGMAPLKNRFTGLEKGNFDRAASSQKCVRAGGKHNDLDNVGYTARHHTFFEMLGNFSFGDYFKENAIEYAWRLLTQDYGLSKDRLHVTVYHTDDEAAALWKKIAGLSDERIIRISTNDNFWSMGDTGPCGPCSEIFYDHGAHIPGGLPGTPDEDGDRFVEIWNLVFMQFEKKSDGTMIKLPKPSIDTGMGLERISAVLQGEHDNFNTDIFRTIIEKSADLTGGEPDGKYKFSYRVLADHLRSVAFLIADGVTPSNEGRGYVLRRILRRAGRHAGIISPDHALIYKLVPALIEKMGDAYPELSRAKELIEETLETEENAFRQTLSRGLIVLEEACAKITPGAALSGDVAFKLYDTYGFPLDLTQDILRDRKIGVDTEGFETAMGKQRDAARAARSEAGGAVADTVFFEMKKEFGETNFVGYGAQTETGEILAILKDGERVTRAERGDEVILIVDQTPFYAESGGQIGDCGVVKTAEGAEKAEIFDVKKKAGGLHAHYATVTGEALQVGETLTLEVQNEIREAIRANHSATHILHEALRRVLGKTVSQKGSLVTADRARFDFSHNRPVSAAEIEQIEKIINRVILRNAEVKTEILTADEAVTRGALALFGEKYGDKVRTLFIGSEEKPEDRASFSVELCGGTHVSRTGDIGACVIISEAGVSAGVRRIEAVTGEKAIQYLRDKALRLKECAEILKCPEEDAPARLTVLLEERRKFEREVAELKQKLLFSGSGASAADDEKMINGIRFVGKIIEGLSSKELAGAIDRIKNKIGSGVVMLIALNDGKIAIAVGVTDDLTGGITAPDLARAAAAAAGGKGGGGRPDFAQAGGSDPAKAKDALSAAEAKIAALSRA